MIKVTYYYSACVAITTPDVSILCDPWFTDGIYDGSWYQYPKVKNPIELIGKHDLIYVSHIHPDHYDPKFIKEYLKVYPDTIVLIAEGVFLDKKMDADGIPYLSPTTIEPYLRSKGLPAYGSTFMMAQTSEMFFWNKTFIAIVPNDTGSISDIDTALVVRYQNDNWFDTGDGARFHTVINMNDNQFYKPQIDRINELAFNRESVKKYNNIIALIGYTGAGSYPQTYYTDDDTLEDKALEKKTLWFSRYVRMAKALDAQVNIPFAGQYILGGKLSHLNQYRGVADAVEVLEFDPRAVVLEEGASIDTDTLRGTDERYGLYDVEDMERYASTLTKSMDYMNDFKYLSPDKIPWERLLNKAAKNAFAKSEYTGDRYYIIIKFWDKYFVCSLTTGRALLVDELSDNYSTDSSLIEIDYRYLFGLITGVYHWNNAEVGSQYNTTRVPDKFDRSVQRFLNFFVV